MPFVCLQCCLREFVAMLEKGLDPALQPATTAGVHECSPEEHVRAAHPDLKATRKERRELEARAAVLFAQLRRRNEALAKAAPNN